MNANLIGTILVYLGLLTFLVGGLSILRPLSFLGIWSRVQAMILVAGSVALFLIGVSLPAAEQRVQTSATRLDEFVPAYQFGELHSIHIQAPRERVYAAVRAVTADEISLFQTLTWIRRFGRPGPESILNPPPNEPILALALRTNFMKLAEEPNREIVLGTLVAAPKGTRLKELANAKGPLDSAQDKRVAGSEKDPTPEDFKALHDPGFGLAAINFRLEDAGSGETLLTTETRVYATDDSARKKFARYWRVIYPGSWLLRVTWLQAIERRAETRQGNTEVQK